MKRYIQSIVWMFGMILLVACQAEDLESTNGAAYWVEGVGDGTQVVPTPGSSKATMHFTALYDEPTNSLTGTLKMENLWEDNEGDEVTAIEFCGPAENGKTGTKMKGIITKSGYESNDSQRISLSGYLALLPDEVRVLKEGKVYLTVRTRNYPDGIVRAQLKTTLVDSFDKPAMVKSLAWDGNERIIIANPGDEMQLKVTVLPTYATDKTVKWESSEPGVATISETGYLKITGDGKTIISASTVDGSNLRIEAIVAVNFVPVTDIDLGTKLINLFMDETISLMEPVYIPETADQKELEWKVEDESIISFDEATRTITPLAYGTTTISAIAKDGFGTVSSLVVRVVQEGVETFYIPAADFNQGSGVGTENSKDTEQPVFEKQANRMTNGSWMGYDNYQVDLMNCGSIALRYSSPNNGSKVYVRLDDRENGPTVAEFDITSTGNWTNYKTIETTALDLTGVDLSKKHTVYLVFQNSGGYACNLVWIGFKPVKKSESCIGAAYFTTGNAGTENSKDTEEPVFEKQANRLGNGTWMGYDSNPLYMQKYTTVSLRYSSASNGGKAYIRLDDKDNGPTVATFDVAGTGNWSNYRTIDTTLNLDGVDLGRNHVVYIIFECSSGYVCNLVWIWFK
ncbi:hypothetical protein GGR06_001165 [Bacteroides reticulotermitis]|uniref:CBM6 domain-containing protein n=2 Tax=Bacteroides reticulotermitis TaxID=1133319 RepID=A0A840CZ53_9BACE|nr:carbohydrate-binding protein [Bacteroides reticulotermitis]MBB4043398.1 hypothetical protein [Bacteroides reticulotermitis]